VGGDVPTVAAGHREDLRGTRPHVVVGRNTGGGELGEGVGDEGNDGFQHRCLDDDALAGSTGGDEAGQSARGTDDPGGHVAERGPHERWPPLREESQ
jgi:hypothetical protein